MYKLIVLLTFLLHFNCILTNPTSIENSVTSKKDESSSSSSSSDLVSSTESSDSNSSQSEESNSSNYSEINNSEDAGDFIQDTEEPKTTPDKTTTKPEQPTTTPDQPTTNPDQPTTKPDQTNTTPDEPISASKGIDAFNKGNTKFTARFFNEMVKANPGKSVVMSVYSTLFLLALLAYFAGGQTLTELLAPLDFKNKNEIPVTIPAILDSISEQTKVNLTLAARVYGNIKYEFSDNFKAESLRIIRAPSQNIDFSNPQKAADIINKWVADNTNNKIKDLIPADLLTPDTAIVLTNAFYFLGEWRSKFEKDATSSKEFYKSDNSKVMVDTMRQVNYFNYAESSTLDCQALELPYMNNNLTCLILLPRKRDGVPSLVAKLTDDNALTSVRSSLNRERVDVSMPKFKTTTSIDLKEMYEKLGINTMFTERSNLQGIMADGSRIQVTAAIQKATIEVDEKGSEAAAANAIIGVRATSVGPPPPRPIPFNANNPFIYFLMYNETPIFCGKYEGN